MGPFGQDFSAQVPNEKAAEFYLEDLAEQNEAAAVDVGDSVDIGEESAPTGFPAQDTCRLP